jgi:hypothetical protein
MDQDQELARFKWIFFAGMTFLVSAYWSFGELKFAIRGKTAEAKITGTHKSAGMRRYGRSNPMLAVEYQFTEVDGTPRSERDDVPAGWPLPPSGNATVQYLPGVSDSSRLLGHSQKTAVYVFLGCTGWLGFSCFKLWREAAAAVHRAGPRRKQRRRPT